MTTVSGTVSQSSSRRAPLTLVPLAFALVATDKALFVAAVLARLLAIILVAAGTIPDFLPPAFALVLADKPLLAAAFPAVATFVVATRFDEVITCQYRQLRGGQQESCKCDCNA